MDSSIADELLHRARSMAAESDPSGVLAAIDDALNDIHGNPEVSGRLFLARAIAMQCGPDPVDAARAAETASTLLRSSTDRGAAAYAAAAASVLAQRAGDTERTVELAVESLVALPDADPASTHALSASNALAQSFALLSAFDLAVDLAEQAFVHAAHLPKTVGSHYAYNLGFCAIEACHGANVAHNVGEAGNFGRWHALTHAAADYLDTYPVGSRLAAGLRGELALLREDHDRFAACGPTLYASSAADLPFYDSMGERLVSWHRLVRASAARRWMEPVDAVHLLDMAIPRFKELGDNHRLARALHERALAHMSIKSPAAAATDALELASLSRRWQAQQVGRLAHQIVERADGERARIEASRRAQAVSDEAAVDVVSGVASRMLLESRLDEVGTRSTGNVAIAIVDVDRFKVVNDAFGHPIGDRVLAEVGAVLLDAARASDTVARYGGDEFVLVMDDLSATEAGAVAARVRASLGRVPWDDIAKGLTVSASAGVASGPAGHARDVLRLADIALYQAKQEGRDRVVMTEVDPSR